MASVIYRIFSVGSCVLGRSVLRGMAGLILLTGIACPPVFAGGFIILDQSARSSGMGSLGAPSASDPSPMYWNPAFLSQLRGTHFSFGAMVMLPEQRFNGIHPSQAEYRGTPQVLFPPNFYLTHTFGRGWGIGLSLNFPYSERVEWGSDWTGSTLATRSEVRIASVNAAVSIPIGHSTSFGAAVLVNIPRLSVALRVPSSADSSATIRSLDGTGTPSFRFQFGMLHEIIDGVTLSVAYRSAVSLRIDDGQVTSQDASGAKAGGSVGTFVTNLDLPHEFETGISWQPGTWIVFSARGSMGLWSAVKQNRVVVTGSPPGTVTTPMHWKNAASAGGGIEVSFADMSLRGGYRWQQSPIPDGTLSPALPDADASGFSVGLGYHVEEGLVLDFSFARLEYRERAVITSTLTTAGGTPFNGLYSGRTTAVGLNISYSWD
jgi:long-chain fatty acid transport protein